jgi:DNA-binding response OmpR family regulator
MVPRPFAGTLPDPAPVSNAGVFRQVVAADVVMAATTLAEALQDRLLGHRLALVPVTSLVEATALLKRGVVVVEDPPADADAVAAVGLLRRRRTAIQLMLLNEPQDIPARLDALAGGFDDAVPSTLDVLEIAGRIGILLERSRAGDTTLIRVGDGVDLDIAARGLRRDGRLVQLRPIEFRLLEELARHAGRPVSRAVLLRRVWGPQRSNATRTIDVHVRWLREKLERRPEAPVHLLTVRGVGYQLEPDATADG